MNQSGCRFDWTHCFVDIFCHQLHVSRFDICWSHMHIDFTQICQGYWGWAKHMTILSPVNQSRQTWLGVRCKFNKNRWYKYDTQSTHIWWDLHYTATVFKYSPVSIWDLLEFVMIPFIEIYTVSHLSGIAEYYPFPCLPDFPMVKLLINMSTLISDICRLSSAVVTPLICERD